jgi:hypothetical protein
MGNTANDAISWMPRAMFLRAHKRKDGSNILPPHHVSVAHPLLALVSSLPSLNLLRFQIRTPGRESLQGFRSTDVTLCELIRIGVAAHQSKPVAVSSFIFPSSISN